MGWMSAFLHQARADGIAAKGCGMRNRGVDTLRWLARRAASADSFSRGAFPEALKTAELGHGISLDLNRIVFCDASHARSPGLFLMKRSRPKARNEVCHGLLEFLPLLVGP